MNDKLIEALFTRRKEAITRLILCVAISALLAVASRIPILFVSLPASWISGGLSIAFIWSVGPVVVLLFQAYSLHGLAEAEQLRGLLASQSRQGQEVLTNISQGFGEELAPIWRKDFPPLIHLAFAVVLLAPVIANVVFISSFLQCVRHDDKGKQIYTGWSWQMADAFLGVGGWHWFQPLAPSLQDNLRILASRATKAEDKEKYLELADEIPWAFFPVQTWAYVVLIGISFHAMLFGWFYAAGKNTAGLQISRLHMYFRRRFQKS
jgi:hypothetical protein